MHHDSCFRSNFYSSRSRCSNAQGETLSTESNTRIFRSTSATITKERERNLPRWRWPRCSLSLSSREWCWMAVKCQSRHRRQNHSLLLSKWSSNSPAGRLAPSCTLQRSNWWNWRNRRYRLHRNCRSRWGGWRRYCSVWWRTVRSRQLKRKRERVRIVDHVLR